MRELPGKSAVRLLVALALVAAPIASHAQAGRIALPSFESLAKKATSSVNISLDPSLLALATQFMDNDPDAAAVKDVVSGIEGIYVRSFQFAADNAYPQSDVDRVRKQIDVAGWKKLISIHKSPEDEDVDVCMLRQNNRIQGVVIIATNPRKFTIVNIVGSVDLAKLSKLQGKFGIPNLPLGQGASGQGASGS